MKRRTILVVEDEASIRKIIRTYLENAGFVVACVDNGPDAIDMNRKSRPDLIVLDLNLMGMDGIEVAARIREESDVYIVMLTARGEEEDRIAGLRIGADDYLTKPFSPRELVVRVETILRRQRGATAESRLLRFGRLSVDPEGYEASVEGHALDLTATEFQLLLHLANNAGRVLTRDQLIERVWGREFYGNDRVVDVYVGQVRRKLQELMEERLIETVRGVGYKFTGHRN
jgi:two-component system alkaline phosphatase synthesis response regulator PhoP